MTMGGTNDDPLVRGGVRGGAREMLWVSDVTHLYWAVSQLQ